MTDEETKKAIERLEAQSRELFNQAIEREIEPDPSDEKLWNEFLSRDKEFIVAITYLVSQNGENWKDFEELELGEMGEIEVFNMDVKPFVHHIIEQNYQEVANLLPSLEWIDEKHVFDELRHDNIHQFFWHGSWIIWDRT